MTDSASALVPREYLVCLSKVQSQAESKSQGKRLLGRNMAPLLDISSSAEFARAEHTVETWMKEPTAGADATHMLGFLRRRGSHPRPEAVRYLSSEDGTAIARVEKNGRGKVDCALCAARSTDQAEYGRLVETLVDACVGESKGVMVSSVPEFRIPLWSQVFQRKGLKIGFQGDFVWFTRDATCPTLMQPAEGFVLGDLDPSDATLVNHHWPYGGPESVPYIKDMIVSHPSVCVRRLNGSRELVAWVLTYPYGALGSLHVVEDCRRLGFGTLLVEALSAKLIAIAANEPNQPAPTLYAYAAVDNTASRSLFSKLDTWQIREGLVSWSASGTESSGPGSLVS